MMAIRTTIHRLVHCDSARDGDIPTSPCPPLSLDSAGSPIGPTEQVKISPESQPTIATIVRSRPRELFAAHWRRLLPLYALLGVENTLRVAQPFFLGWAINDLLNHSSRGVVVLVAQYLVVMLIAALRQWNAARVFNRLSIAAEMSVLPDRSQPREESRSTPELLQVRQSISVLERGVPLVIHASLSLLGAIAMLGWYDVTLVPLCLVLLIPAFLLNAANRRKSSLFSTRLRHELEREPQLLATGERRDIRRHLETLALWRVKQSDTGVTNFCLLELFVIGVMATALIQYCLNQSPQPGDIFAVLQYVLMFVAGLRGVPFAVRDRSEMRGAGVAV